MTILTKRNIGDSDNHIRSILRKSKSYNMDHWENIIDSRMESNNKFPFFRMYIHGSFFN